MDETAVIAAIVTALDNDSVLNTLLSKSAYPWGIYRHNFIPDNDPPFPLVTFEWLGGPTSRSGPWEDNVALVTIRVYHAPPAPVFARIEKLLNLRTKHLTATDADVRSIQNTVKGADLWDDEYQVHFRPDSYLIRYRLYGEINT